MNNLDFKTDINYLETEKIRDFLNKRISAKRLSHTLATAEKAVELSNIFLPENDRLKIEPAALLHDITKELSVGEQSVLCEKYNIPLTEDDKNTPKCFHAKTAAYIAKAEFGADNDVFSAIYKHCLGAESMSTADMIIYLADYIEDTRTYKDCVKVREFFYSNLKTASGNEEKAKVLSDAVFYALNITISTIIKEDLFLHSETIKARNALLNVRL